MLKSILHKIYLATQVLVLITGIVLIFIAVYSSSSLIDGTTENAENCSMLAMKKDIALKNIAIENSIGWDQALQLYIGYNKNYKTMKQEADRITKLCKNYLVVDVAPQTGVISVFVLKNGKYETPRSWEVLILQLAFIFGATGLVSILLFIVKKWIKFILKT